MKFRLMAAISLPVLITGCDGRSGVGVAESRGLTTRDVQVRLGATSDERFRNTRPSPVVAEAPAHWLSLPSTEFRLLNYRAGESGLIEVWVSVASGSVLDNVNRWLNQFSKPEVDAAGLEAMRKVPISGVEGVWVEANGEYAPGMMSGGGTRTDQALAGVIAEVGAGNVLTVKMVGPEKEVQAATADLEAFVGTIRMKEGGGHE